jgi:hypothetical protein
VPHRVTPPVRIEAELFNKQLSSGKSRPIVVSGRGASGASVECVVKLVPRLTIPPSEYLFEWVAVAIAKVLVIQTPDPFEVIITKDFAEAIDDPAVRTDAMKSVGSTFGCKFMAGYSQWVGPLQPELRVVGSDLLAFDVYIHNPDRRRDNPNVLATRNEIVAIDHGEAFSFLFAIGGADPADDPLLAVVARHVFMQALKGQLTDLTGFRRALDGLSDAYLSAVASATPAEWQRGQASGKLAKILDVVKRRRDRLEKWLPPVVTACAPA